MGTGRVVRVHPRRLRRARLVRRHLVTGGSIRRASRTGRWDRGVKTHPSSRRRGLAKVGIQRAIEFFREQADIGFAVLVCGVHLIAYYERLGWREFSGQLLVQQHGSTVEFTFNRIMTYGIQRAAPEAGTIDLLGPPW